MQQDRVGGQDQAGDAGLPAASHAGNLLEFLAWLAAGPRTYADTMEAWRTSCPRLSAWEDANAAGLVDMECAAGVPRAQAVVLLTAKGKAVLRRARPPSA
ncbi:hypothetical protein AB4156_18890 [Cupriavidus sp. 2MCAB6]|uniref:hypothetical protein n=1 Tax=Cupriavidus sp. 2MCAB6 TaxID=3232981 RepID=UPI003F8F8E9B